MYEEMSGAAESLERCRHTGAVELPPQGTRLPGSPPSKSSKRTVWGPLSPKPTPWIVSSSPCLSVAGCAALICGAAQLGHSADTKAADCRPRRSATPIRPGAYPVSPSAQLWVQSPERKAVPGPPLPHVHPPEKAKNQLPVPPASV